MGNLRSVRPSALAATLLAVVAFTVAGCSSSGATGPTAAPAPTATWTPTPAADPVPASMDADTSAAATCGRISTLTTMTLNAREGGTRGELSDDQVRALLAAARFGYEHLATTDEGLQNAVGYTQRYLEQHPAPASGPALDDSADWDIAMRALGAACQDAGSSVVADAQYGG